MHRCYLVKYMMNLMIINRYVKSIYFDDLEFLPFVLTFIGKLNYPSVLMFTNIVDQI